MINYLGKKPEISMVPIKVQNLASPLGTEGKKKKR
jgi:hypothetical protein